MNSLTITEQKQERFRTLPGQAQYFPKDVNINDYKVIGYLLGERIDYLKGMTLDLFDCVNFLCFSSNARNKRKFMHVLAYRNENKDRPTVLILKLK